MNISTVIARHKSVFSGSPSPAKEAGAVRAEVPPIKDVPSNTLPKREKSSPKGVAVDRKVSKDFPSLKSVVYPKLDSARETSPPPSFGEEGLISYLRQKRSYLPQNMEVDGYD